ncbi:MAG: ABC transporter permease [Bacteroidales bacterium]|nr:ABC transporter permease [Bacteroidales bacterium]
MSAALFLAQRIRFLTDSGQKRVAPPAIRIAIAGIAIGVTVMILTVAIVLGFKDEIRTKISDFGGDMQVLALASNRTFEKQPICYNDSLLEVISQMENVRHVMPFITKPAVIKTPDDFLSVVIKSDNGLGDREICISESTAQKLRLKLGDKVQVYFVQSNNFNGSPDYGGTDASVKVRSLTVTGFYQTHFSQYDDQIILGNTEMLQQVGGWDEDMASGISVHIKDFDRLSDTYDALSEQVSLTQDRRGTQYAVQHIQEQNPQIFGWLELLDTNVWVILLLMVVVASFTMISGLLIIILEKRQMIGLLKALGADNSLLRRTFLLVAGWLILQGLLWGDIIGVGLCAIQYYWHPLTLDPANYYLEWVPISISVWHVVALNAGALVVTMLMLLVPSSLVSRIAPGRILSND